MNLIERIYQLIQTDDEPQEKSERHLRDAYDGASEETQDAIDACFTALCGYRLGTLLAEADDELANPVKIELDADQQKLFDLLNGA